MSLLFLLSFILFLSLSSLELFFASSQNNKLLYGEPPTSPRASRKFSSPPPLSITKTSSPNRRRKLSLNIPIITGGKALDLAALSCSPNGYASMHSTMSPFSKTTLDINKLYVSSTMASKISDDGEAKAEGKAEESVLNKQGQNRCLGDFVEFHWDSRVLWWYILLLCSVPLSLYKLLWTVSFWDWTGKEQQVSMYFFQF